MQETHIRCPKCLWEPDGKPYWQCHCGHAWDTFSTGGVCPKCKHRHKDTQCIDSEGGCGKMSPHIDWYGGLDNLVDEFLEEERVPVWLRHGDVR